MNVKFIFMSLIVLGLIFNITSFSDLAFADKPDKEEAKAERKEVKVQREEVKVQREEIKEFVDSTIITTSSTTTICHIPPGNPGNNHTITIGNSAVSAHIGHGDKPTSCELANWEEDGSNANEQELKNTEMDENLVDEITKQIANLQQRLQKLLGI